MRMKWNDATIKFFKEASEYTNFHKNLAQYLKPLLKNYNSMCDIGCGLGLIDIYLNECIKDITCIDVNEHVIKSLKNDIKEKNIKNIKCYKKDYKNIDEFFDIILISFFGYEEIEFFSKHCKRLIAIVNNKVNPHIPEFSSKSKIYKVHSASNLENLLKEKKLKYTVKSCKLEFGQIFNNEKEIEEYAKYYDGGDEYEEIYNHIIKNTNKDRDIFYLPYEKNFSIFSIDFQ